MSGEPIPFGAFELIAPAGRGGMGEVWRGWHRAEGVPVAIKVLSPELASDPELCALFRHEVRMAASLDHPSVVLLFDQGTVPEEAAHATTGRLGAGTPYLVMEWASGGTLSSHALADGDELVAVLRDLLDALAHAHARGVVHRDLKPSNVLVCGPSDLRPGLKLADFGAAYRGAASLSEEGSEGADLPAIAGTKSYMAPEQAEQRYRDEGPWTDLFSLGVLAHRLATGRLPWPSPRDPADRYRLVPAPATIAVPPGFAAWLARLLAPNPRDRFVCAAEARAALDELGVARSTPTAPLLRSDPDAPTVLRPASAPPLDAPRSWPPIGPGRPMIEGGPRLGPAPRIDDGPPPERMHPRPRLLGAGLGLWGLRQVPLVDREAERAVLWEALAETARARHARLVVLSGAAGCGKSRLAAWLVERAHERGHAVALRALHAPIASAGDGAGPMLARHFGVAGAPPDEAAARVTAILADLGVPPAELEASVADLLSWAELAPASPRPVTERWEMASRVLARLSARRPVVLWLDDVQWGAATLALVQHLFDAQVSAPAPILVLATVRDDALADRPVERALLDALRSRPEARSLALGPLPEEHRGALVRGLLGLDAELAARVEEHTEGNPAFAVELVADWARRELLEHGPTGFRLRAGAEVGLSTARPLAFAAALDHVLAARVPADALALEVAAAFGVGIDPGQWREVCERLGVRPSEGLLEILSERGLVARRSPTEPFSFAHGMLREALAMRAKESGRAPAQHRAWAESLAGSASSSVDRREQLGRHLLAAGEAVAAAEHLGPAIEARLTSGEASRAYALAIDVERALSGAGLEPERPARARLRALRADAARALGRYDEAAQLAEEVGRGPAEPAIRAHALLVRGVVSRERGEPDQALSWWNEGLALAAGQSPLRAAQLAWWIGVALTDRGELSDAAKSFDAALADAPPDDHALRVNAEVAYAGALRLMGRDREAETMLESALLRARRLGRGPVATVRNALGELSRWRGHFDAAERHYEEAAQLYEAVGSRSTAVAQLNLGLTRIEAGRPADAEVPLRSSLELARRLGRRGVAAMALAGLLAPAAARGDWAAWDETLVSLTGLVGSLRLVEIDVARAASRAAELATARGEGLRAIAAYELAVAQLTALGRADEAAPLQLLLDGLRTC